MRVFLVSLLCLAPLTLRAESSLWHQLPERLMPEIGPMIEAGLSQSDQARAEDLARREAEGARLSSRSAVLPTFGMSSTYRREQDFENSFGHEQRDRMIYFVTLSQPLYHWGARRSEKRIGELLYEIGMIEADGAAERIVSAVRTGYMDMVLARQDREIRQRALERRRSDLAVLRQRREDGLVSDDAVESVALELDRAELAWQRESLEWENGLADLAQFIGQEPDRVEARLRDSIPDFEPLSPEQIERIRRNFAASLASDDALQMQERAVAIQKERLHIENQSLKPKFDAQIGLSLNPLEEDGVRREQEFAFVGLRLNWNIFDGFRSKGRRMEALARLERQEDSRRRLAETLERNYGRAVDRLEFARRSVVIEDRILARQTAALTKGEEDREAGRISEDQFESIRQNHAQASLASQRQRVAYLNALSDLLMLLRVDPFVGE